MRSQFDHLIRDTSDQEGRQGGMDGSWIMERGLERVSGLKKERAGFARLKGGREGACRMRLSRGRGSGKGLKATLQ